MTIVLDAGALVAVERGDRTVGALLKVAQQREIQVCTSAGVVAQVWRGGARQARVARVLLGVRIVSLDNQAAREVGGLLALSTTTDVVDAHVALLAHAGDDVLTSDPLDLDQLLRVRNVRAIVTLI